MWGGRKHCHPVWPHATEVALALGQCLAVQLLHPTAARQGRHSWGTGPWPQRVPITGILGSEGGSGPCRGSQ